MRTCYGILGSLITLSVCSSASGQPCESWTAGDPPPGLRSAIHSAALWDADGDGPEAPSLVVSYDPENFRQWRMLRWTGEEWETIGEVFRSGQRGPQLVSWDPDGDGPLGEHLLTGSGTVARFDGATWHDFGAGLSNGGVYSFAVWDADGDGPIPPRLVAGGNFTVAGSPSSRSVAMWDGAAWAAMDGGLGTSSDRLDVYSLATFDPDGEGPIGPQLVAAGNFDTTRPGEFLRCVARWDGAGWHPIGNNGAAHLAAAISAAKHRRGDGRPDDLVIAVSPGYSTQTINLPSPVMVYTNLGLPGIATQPADVAAEAGAEVMFTVQTTGEGPHTYRWRRDGQALEDGPSAGGGVISGEATPTLTISGVRLADGGVYGVVVSGECGDRTSAGAVLTVICRADWDGNAAENSNDISAFLAGWLGSVQDGSLAADFNGDGAVNSNDISAFLSAWLAAVQGGC